MADIVCIWWQSWKEQTRTQTARAEGRRFDTPGFNEYEEGGSPRINGWQRASGSWVGVSGWDLAEEATGWCFYTSRCDCGLWLWYRPFEIKSNSTLQWKLQMYIKEKMPVRNSKLTSLNAQWSQCGHLWWIFSWLRANAQNVLKKQTTIFLLSFNHKADVTSCEDSISWNTLLIVLLLFCDWLQTTFFIWKANTFEVFITFY